MQPCFPNVTQVRKVNWGQNQTISSVLLWAEHVCLNASAILVQAVTTNFPDLACYMPKTSPKLHTNQTSSRYHQKCHIHNLWSSHSLHFFTPRLAWARHAAESQNNPAPRFQHFLELHSSQRQRGGLHECSPWSQNACSAWKSHWSSLWVTCGPGGCVALCYSIHAMAVIDIEK